MWLQNVGSRAMLTNFFSLGVLNNVTYVIMIAGSPEIAADWIGIVYLCAVGPAIVVKFSSQYWFGSVPYAHRMTACATLMALSLLLVAFGTSVSTKLLGVVCCSLQSALGEASCLALTSRFPSSERRLLLTGWSSGTGIAGIAGYVWVSMFLHLLNASFTTMLLSALLTLPAAWTYIYFRQIHGKFCDVHEASVFHEDDEKGEMMERQYALDYPVMVTAWGTFRSLMPYSMPLFLVYFAEYACQSGVWITIGFPPESVVARKQFYSASNTMYQAGVFLSRSSGAVFELTLWQLPWLAVFQFGLLCFFIAVSLFKFFYGWWLLIPAFVTGVFGGLCYVNAFRLLSFDSHPAVREKNLALTSTADSLGVACADLIGIALQKWLS